MKSPFVSNIKVWLLFPLLFITMLFFSSCSGTRSVQDDVYTSYSPPPWAPAYGYRASTRYVFFPEIGVYYDLYQNNYIYPYDNFWVVVQRLPPAYSSYDLRRLRQQQFSYRSNPQRYAPRPHQGTIRENPPVYTPRRGETPPARTPRNNPQTNQRQPTINPPVSTPHRNNPPATRPPQNTPQRNERTPDRNPVQTSPRRGGDPSVRNQQPERRNEIPSRVNPPQTKSRGSDSPPPRTNSRRGGGAI
jgi:hypothetical protein